MCAGINRRGFLKMVGVGGVGFAAGCSNRSAEKLLPYLIPPEDIIPGVPTWYATVCRECPAGCGLLVRTREGRAVKVEGNPLHPVNRGRLCARGQASLQGLYNPDRIAGPLEREESGEFQARSWEEAETRLAEKLADLRRSGKEARAAIVTHLTTDSLGRLIDDWTSALGFRDRLIYEPFAYEPLRAAGRIAFGREDLPVYRIEEADLLLSFGADFLETWTSPVEYARAFRAMRALQAGRTGRFIYIGSRRSMTAANADEWISTAPGTEGILALSMIHVILNEGRASLLTDRERQRLEALVEEYSPEKTAHRTGVPGEVVRRLARTFAGTNPGLALGGDVASSGRNATPTLMALHVLNYITGNVGRTLAFGPNKDLARPGAFRQMNDLIEAMEAERIEVLLLYGVNPVFTMPSTAGFEAALKKVPFTVSFSSFMDETTARADLVMPDHTFLEAWGDCVPRDGIHSLMQPVTQPLFETKAIGDVLLSIGKRVDEKLTDRFPWSSFEEYLKQTWKERRPSGEDFEIFWREALQRGGIWEAEKIEPVRLSPEIFDVAFEEPAFDGEEEETYSLIPYPSLFHFDGRGANRPWLQELPDPMTKITWSTWAEIHPEQARRLGIEEGDRIALVSPHGRIEVPVHLSPGIRPDCVAVPIGQGHTAYGRYAEGRGENPVDLLSSEPERMSGGLPWLSTKVKLVKLGRRQSLASTSGSSRQFGRGIAQTISLEAALRADRRSAPESDAHHPKDLYKTHEHPEHRWGMVIDLDACTGCGACAAACYAENNVAVVGEKRVAEGREMSWIRIERYFEDSRVLFIPMLCQHCDNAPCEPVCPVFATYHTPDGLNAQIYNRCVGTRYCSNNCPYKVRRFNWFRYEWPKPLHRQLNPDISVREKGVMEKCTFCVQRIREARERAKDEGRKVRDGEIVPACAQTCPTSAMRFGDLKDPDSHVSKRARDPRNYRVLESLNTKPAITYLKKITRT